MAEYIQTVDVPANAARVIALPNGIVHGVYSTVAVNIDWIENNQEGQILAAVTEWEPHGGFTPRPTSALRVTNTTATAGQVVLRLEYVG